MGFVVWQMLTQDMKYAVRNLARRPGFAAVTIISLILGIVPVTVIGSIINAGVLRPPRHVESPDRLVAVFVTGDPSIGYRYGGLLYPDAISVREHVSAFQDVLVYNFGEFNLMDDAGPSALHGNGISKNYFDVLGVRMAVGRSFSAVQQETDSEEDTVVLGYVAWQRRFNGDPGILGKMINLDGKLRTVIGVAPQGLLNFTQPVEPDIYVPLPDSPIERRASRRLSVMARLRPGTTIEQARSQLQVLQGQLREEYPRYWSGDGRSDGLKFAAFPESETRLPINHRLEITLALGLMMFLGFLVLMTACSNLASLLLARGSERSQEIAIRLALGAERRRVIGLLLTESLILFCVAGAAGLLIVHWISQTLASGYLLPGMERITVDFTVDMNVAGSAVILSLATGLLFGLVPALQTSRPDLISAFKGEAVPFGRPGRRNVRNLFVVAQVSISLILLVTAGLFIKGFQRATTVDLGFEPDGIVAVQLDLQRDFYQVDESRRFFDEMEQRLRARPDISGMSFTVWAPFVGRSISTGIQMPDGSRDAGFINLVGNDYFKLMKTPLLAGRHFRETDAGAPVVIVNESLARSIRPDESAEEILGERFTPTRTGKPVEIIGVVRDSKYTYLAEPRFSHLMDTFLFRCPV